MRTTSTLLYDVFVLLNPDTSEWGIYTDPDTGRECHALPWAEAYAEGSKAYLSHEWAGVTILVSGIGMG